MITVNEADRLLREHIWPRPPVGIPLTEASQRVLREDIAADRDYPPYDRVAMDGIAVSSSTLLAGVREFPVHGLQKAGEAPQSLSHPSACLEIMTGASLPAGADTIIRYEDIELRDGRAYLAAGVEFEARQNIHPRASDRKAGDPVLQKGAKLHAPQIAILASMGRATVKVSAPWSISILTTGDELVEVHEPVLPHQIRRSNAYAIRAACIARGHAVQTQHAIDDERVLTEKIEAALQFGDMLILSGGVSMGKFDLVPAMLARLGVRNVFHKIAQKPGKPLWFGVRADGRPVFGLPGNPVSALVCLYRYVIPYMDACDGLSSKPESLWMPELRKNKKGLTSFAAVTRNGIQAVPVVENGSGDFASLGESDGFVEISPDDNAAFPGGGYVVPFYPWGAR